MTGSKWSKWELESARYIADRAIPRHWRTNNTKLQREIILDLIDKELERQKKEKEG